MDDPRATEADTLRRNAELRPLHIAINFQGRTTTYFELNRRASRVANGLLHCDPTPQRRIALLTKNSDAFFEVLFGIAKARAIAIPTNWRLAAKEIAQILIDAQPDTLFVGADFANLVREIQRWGAQIKVVVQLDGKISQANESFDDYGRWRDGQSDKDPRIDVMRKDIFLQVYTSGTTGAPKGVQISHDSSMKMRSLEVGTRGKWTDWDATDVSIVAMPNFHIGGTSWALQWFARGATCIVQAQVDPGAMLDSFARDEVTHVFAVPTVLDMILADERCKTTDFKKLKLVHYGGSPITPALLLRCIDTFGTQFVQYFGMTETNGVIAVLEPNDHDLDRPELLKSCGRPYPDVDLRIMNTDGQELPAGEVGEVCVDTPCLMSGYWRLPEAMRQCKHGNYYRTGDAGYKNADGFLFLVDRVKDMIVSGGENIYPIEVERVLGEHPGVDDAAVIGVPDARWGEAVKAIVVLRDVSVDETTLFEFLKERIARYKVPKSIDFVNALPRNGAGKVLKRVLRDQHGNNK